jgi:hypothetical protein
MVKEFQGTAGIFARDNVRFFQSFRCPETYIAQIPDWSPYNK